MTESKKARRRRRPKLEARRPRDRGRGAGAAGDTAVDHVEDAGADDHQARIEEVAVGIHRAGMTEKERRNDVDNESDEGEDIGRDAGQRQSVHDSIK